MIAKEYDGKRCFSKLAHEEVARPANEEGLQIDLVPSDDLIRCDSKALAKSTKTIA